MKTTTPSPAPPVEAEVFDAEAWAAVALPVQGLTPTAEDHSQVVAFLQMAHAMLSLLPPLQEPA